MPEQFRPSYLQKTTDFAISWFVSADPQHWHVEEAVQRGSAFVDFLCLADLLLHDSPVL